MTDCGKVGPEKEGSPARRSLDWPRCGSAELGALFGPAVLFTSA